MSRSACCVCQHNALSFFGLINTRSQLIVLRIGEESSDKTHDSFARRRGQSQSDLHKYKYFVLPTRSASEMEACGDVAPSTYFYFLSFDATDVVV